MATLKDLLKKDAVQIGDTLVWVRKKSGSTFRAQIVNNGKIQTADGQIHNSPSSAAKYCNGGIAVNGWRVWEVERVCKNLLKIREEIQASS